MNREDSNLKKEKIDIWENGEYSYPMAYGFVPNLVAYLHEDEKERPCMLVVPGGGYCVVSPTEGEIVAKKFYEKGYHAFVLTYTTNLLHAAPLKDQPMRDLSRAIRIIRKQAAADRINPGRLVICGFSAGAHLCASVCVHYADVEEHNAAYMGLSNRPDAAILSYPVITSGEKAHRDSFTALLGADATEAELAYYSLETQVSAHTPPCFVWQTATDEVVPVENSYLFAEALKENGIVYAHHVFSRGRHGLSLADRTWADGAFGEPYCMEQKKAIADAIKNDLLLLPEGEKERLLAQFEQDEREEETRSDREANPEVAVWPQLAEAWLEAIWGA
jgi:acetyl esterase/lipase